MLARHMPRTEAQALVKRALGPGRLCLTRSGSVCDLDIDWAQALDSRICRRAVLGDFRPDFGKRTPR